MKITELQKKYELSKDDFWQLSQGKNTWIITHDACERIAKIEKIQFHSPEVHTALDSICLIGRATKLTQEEWSTGEASKENVKMSGKYYWAMAEKRLKDRLTLKLINAYEFGIYSETEADDFKRPTQSQQVEEMPNDKHITANGFVMKPTKNFADLTPKEKVFFKLTKVLEDKTITASDLRDSIKGIENSDKLTDEEKEVWVKKCEDKIIEVNKGKKEVQI